MAFNLRYYGNFRSEKKNQFWRVEIHERNYLGNAEEVLLTANPLMVTWEKQGDDFYETVKASEANCSIFCTEQFKFTNLFTSQARKFRMDIFRNTVLYWRGYVVPDTYSEAFSAPPYHVDVKAVDGFSNLDNVPFLDDGEKQYTGRKSLLELITLCVNSLELDLTLSDWFDLYPEGGDEGVSALSQIYLNMSDLYLAYPDATMRDIIDICLLPMGGQIFQSAGSINIRRVIALRDPVRPLSYFNIARTLADKWLITADGRGLVNEQGQAITVNTNRERLDDMWDGDELVKNTNILSISPAIRKLKIDYSKDSLDNFVERLDIFNPEKWTKENAALTYEYDFELYTGVSGRISKNYRHIIRYLEAQRQGETTPAKIMFDIPVETDVRTLKLSFHYMLNGIDAAGTVNPKLTWWVSCFDENNVEQVYAYENSQWASPTTAGITYKKELESTFFQNLSDDMELQGIPATGKLRISFDISGLPYSREHWLQLNEFEFSVEGGDSKDEDSTAYERIVDVNCTSDLELSLPVASYNSSPNFTYTYALYFVDSEGSPISLFHTRGKTDNLGLLEHMILQALTFHSKAGMMISGDIRSGKHIDMNTVIVDDLYLNKSFYINASEVDCRGDNFNVEMKELIGDSLDTANDGDFHKVDLAGAVMQAFQIEGYIIYTVQATVETYTVYSLNTYSGESIRLFQIGISDTIYSSGQYFIIKRSTGYTAYYPNGKVYSSFNPDEYTGSCNAFFVLDGNTLYMTDITERRPGESERIKTKEALMLTDARVDYEDSKLGEWNPYPTSVREEENLIVIQTSSMSYIFDNRQSLTVINNNSLTNIVAINDFYLANTGADTKIYRRESLPLSKITLAATIANPDKFALGRSEAAYFDGTTLHRITLPDGTVSEPEIGTSGSGSSIIALFYINSALWVVRTNGVYKLCQ